MYVSVFLLHLQMYAFLIVFIRICENKEFTVNKLFTEIDYLKECITLRISAQTDTYTWIRLPLLIIKSWNIQSIPPFREVMKALFFITKLRFVILVRDS